MSGFAPFFGPMKARLSPEVKAAIATILSALFEEPVDLKQKVYRWVKEGGEHVRRKAERERREAAQKKRIERAERAVKTRRKNAKTKTCNSSTSRANSRQYCFKSLGHRGVHSNGFYNWKRSTKKTKRK